MESTQTISTDYQSSDTIIGTDWFAISFTEEPEEDRFGLISSTFRGKGGDLFDIPDSLRYSYTPQPESLAL
jgi:hypothetical protein